MRLDRQQITAGSCKRLYIYIYIYIYKSELGTASIAVGPRSRFNEMRALLAIAATAALSAIVASAAEDAANLSLKLSQLDDEIDQLTVQLGRRLAERRAVSSSLVALLAAAAPTPPLPPPPPPPPEEATAKARHKAKKQRAKDGRRQKRRAVTAQELRSAVTENDVSRLEELLAEGASAEEQNERGNTVLHDAVYYGHDAAVGRLLAVGSPSFFAVGNDEDNTPLHSVAYGGRIGATRLLVDAADAT